MHMVVIVMNLQGMRRMAVGCVRMASMRMACMGMATMRMTGMSRRQAVGGRLAEQAQDGRAELAPQQPGADQGDEGKAHDLHEPGGVGH